MPPLAGGCGMDWDLLIALLYGSAGFYLAYKGLETVNPGERFIFIAIGIVFVALSVAQVYRGNQDKQALQTQLADIQEKISEVLIKPQLNASPTQAVTEHKERSILNLDTQFVTGRLPPFTSKNSFIINIRYTNVTQVPARVKAVWASIYAFDHQIRADEEDVLFTNLHESAKTKQTEDNVLGPGQFAWFTIEPTPKVNDETAARIAQRKLYSIL